MAENEQKVPRDIFTGRVPQLQAGAPIGNSEEAQRLAQETQRAWELEQKIVAAILAVQQAPGMPDEVRKQLLANLRAALTMTGDGQRLAAANAIADAYMGIVYESASETSAEIYYATTVGDDAYVRNAYPDYAYYNKSARKFINEQLGFSAKHSPTLKALETEIKQLSPEVEADAKLQIGENYKKFAELKRNERIKELYGEETLDLIHSYKLQRDPKFTEIVAAMERGEDRGTVMRMVAGTIAKQVNLGIKVRDEMMPHLEKETQEYLKAKYGEPVNMSAVIRDLHKLSTTERNDILQAYEESGHDLSKMKSEHREAIHLLRLGVGVEAAISLQALGGIAKDVKLQKLVSDPSLDPDGKKLAAAISEHMLRSGSTDKVAREDLSNALAELIRNNPEAQKKLAQGDLRGVAMMIKNEFSLDEYVKNYAKAYIEGTLNGYEAQRIGKERVAQEGNQWDSILSRRAQQAVQAIVGTVAVTPTVAAVTPMVDDKPQLPGFPSGITTDKNTLANGVPPEGAPAVANAKPLQLRTDGRPVG